MNKRFPVKGIPLRIPVSSCVLVLAVLFSACASNPNKSGRNPGSEADPRSELVFLNIQEASGWVAYTCNPDSSSETEDYRVVVYRVDSKEVIYDSIIPLASDLCTHGFEMAKDDPRLKRLGQNVDRDIIEPLEAYQQSMDQERAADAGAEEAPAAAPAEPEATDNAAPVSGGESSTVDADPALQTSLADIKGMEGDFILLAVTADSVKAGDRFFLRTPPTVVEIPGTDETMTTSDGEVKGLVEVASVKDGIAKTKLLSGSMPVKGIAEKVIQP